MEKRKPVCFLGGTCNNSTWREKLIPMLTIDYFNPVVDDWTPDCMAEEIKQRETCEYVLYVITPEMTGVYSIAEVADDSNKRPDKTIFCFLSEPNITDDQKLISDDFAGLTERTEIEEIVTDAGYTGPTANEAIEVHNLKQTTTAIKGRKKKKNKLGLEDFKLTCKEHGTVCSIEQLRLYSAS